MHHTKELVPEERVRWRIAPSEPRVRREIERTHDDGTDYYARELDARRKAYGNTDEPPTLDGPIEALLSLCVSEDERRSAIRFVNRLRIAIPWACTVRNLVALYNAPNGFETLANIQRKESSK